MYTDFWKRIQTWLKSVEMFVSVFEAIPDRVVKKINSQKEITS